MVTRWAWNASPEEARKEWMQLGYTASEVANQMKILGFKEADILKVVGKVCSCCNGRGRIIP